MTALSDGELKRRIADDGLAIADCQPLVWFVIFSRRANSWPTRWLTFGRFKHVSAFGRMPDGRHWVVHEVGLNDTAVYVIPDDEFDAKLAEAIQQSVVVRVPRKPKSKTRMRIRAGWWCVPATAHLLGLRSCAFRPDGLFRDCLAQGGTIICGEVR